jgi:molybdopterin converting factor subunit 1
MPRVSVRFLGPSADMVGSSERSFDLPERTTLGRLAGVLSEEYPQLGAAPGVRLAVNRRYAALDLILTDGDEVAVIPPVSGG